MLFRSPNRKNPVDLSSLNIKVDSLGKEDKDFYSSLMEHYELMLLDFKTLDLIDELLPDNSEGKSKADLAREKARNFEGINAIFRRLVESRLRESKVEEAKTLGNRHFDEIYSSFAKVLEDNMIKHVDDDRNQLNYIYERHTKSLFEDTEKLLVSLPIYLRNANYENVEVEKKVGELTNSGKGSNRGPTPSHPELAVNLRREIQDIRLFHYDSMIN